MSKSEGDRLLVEQYGRKSVVLLDWLSVGLMGLCFWIGQEQSGSLKPTFLTSYGADLIGPWALQWPLTRTLFRRLRSGAAISSLLILVGCFAWEFCQLYGLTTGPLAITGGTFDKLDLVAYSLSIAFGYRVDRLARQRDASPDGAPLKP